MDLNFLPDDSGMSPFPQSTHEETSTRFRIDHADLWIWHERKPTKVLINSLDKEVKYFEPKNNSANKIPSKVLLFFEIIKSFTYKKK